MKPGPPTIFISAGEPSGDLHGAGVARALKQRIPGVNLIGLGGPRMAAQGTRLYAGLDDLAVMGFAEVAARLPYFLRLRRRVFSALSERKVDLVIPIDYPGFNLRLARYAQGQGIRVLYYIAPQVWAWHASRAADLARDTDAVAVILPFEEEFLRGAGANARFVGHPLLDLEEEADDKPGWCDRLGLDADRPILALFPGSRRQEISRHLDLFSDAAAEIVRRVPAVQPVLAASPDVSPSLYNNARWPLADRPDRLLRHSTAALVKSGTTTLEAALVPTPFVVAYRMNPLSYAVARRLVKVPHIALANLVAGGRVVPEFVQNQASPSALADALIPLLDASSPARAEMLAGLTSVRAALGAGGAADRVAELAADLLGIPP
ncbi:MAG TPA: lipid-A-disaccharide synthase [Longimicrobiaceae bacterium]|nr:lipid-A-disaccharide synthase [Longimicrobiaceae bacterium]